MSPPSNPSTPLNITLSPTLLPADLYAIAALESHVFYDDPFSIVAFGPERGSEAHIEGRAENLGSLAKRKGERCQVAKAVLTHEDGKEEIVGSGVFIFVTGRKEGGDELLVKDEGGEKKEGEAQWGKSANVQFCEDVMVKGDEYMSASCNGEDYAKLGSLVVSASYQRRGIGTKLLELFLSEADALGLQAVLGASEQGRELYKRYGFTDYHVQELRMWEYVGGEGMDRDEHVVMHRPAVAKKGGLKVVN